MEMLQKLQERLDALSVEAANLVHQRNEHEKKINQVNTRMTQIVGAISELDQIIKESMPPDAPVDDSQAPQDTDQSEVDQPHQD
jgi:predicted nuclease with TOPRIM domain